MTTLQLASHPFGHFITVADLQKRFSSCQQWEERYRQLILLSKQVPPLPEELKCHDIEITDCQNRVWLGYQRMDNDTLHFYGDSEGRIVRGLLAILLTVIEGQTATTLRAKKPLFIFEQLGLLQHLSHSRSNGLQALAETVHRAATESG